MTSCPASAARRADVLPAPGHDQRVVAQPCRTFGRGAREPLVPDHSADAEGIRQHVRDLPEEVCVQRLVARQAEPTAVLRYPRAGPPVVQHALIAADVYAVRGHGPEQLAEYLLERGDRARQRRGDLRLDSPAGRDLVPRAGVGRQLGQRGEHRGGVAGNLDLGNDPDHAARCVGGDLGQVGERVVAAVRGAVAGFRRYVGGADLGLRPVRADPVQARIAAALDPPALVIGQVQVQPVQLVRGQHVDEAEDRALGEEVPGHVQVTAAPSERGRVLDLRAGQGPGRARDRGGAESIVGQQLADGLRGVERPGRVGCGDLHPVGADEQSVPFGRQRAVGVHQDLGTGHPVAGIG